MNRNRSDRLIAAAVTLGVLMLLTVTLMVTTLPAVASNQTELPEQEEVFFTDIEFTEPEPAVVHPTRPVDNKPAAAPASDAGGVDASDAGSAEPAQPALVATTEPQPDNQQVELPEEPTPPAPPVPTQEQIEEEKRASIRNRIGKSTWITSDSDSDTSGASDSGPAKQGNAAASDGLGVKGRSLRYVPDNPLRSHASITNGFVMVNITLDSEGNVTYARYAGVCSPNLGAEAPSLIAQAESYVNTVKYSSDPKLKQQSYTVKVLIGEKNK